MILTRKRKWALTSGALGSLAAIGAQQGLDAAWRRARGTEPPVAPGTRGVTWRKAIAWTALTGAAVALVSLAATGGAAAAWKRVTGRKPPR